MLSIVENTAVRACLAGGRHLAERFGDEVDASLARPGDGLYVAAPTDDVRGAFVDAVR